MWRMWKAMSNAGSSTHDGGVTFTGAGCTR